MFRRKAPDCSCTASPRQTLLQRWRRTDACDFSDAHSSGSRSCSERGRPWRASRPRPSKQFRRYHRSIRPFWSSCVTQVRTTLPAGLSILRECRRWSASVSPSAWLRAKISREGYGLKIWDAYRPGQRKTNCGSDPQWFLRGGPERRRRLDAYPRHSRRCDAGGCVRQRSSHADRFRQFHARGDDRLPGNNPTVRSNLKLLQKAMAHGGFYGLRTEWWHFCAADWTKYPPVPTGPCQHHLNPKRRNRTHLERASSRPFGAASPRRGSESDPPMIEALLRDFRQPEYLHVLLNPLPVYGLPSRWWD